VRPSFSFSFLGVSFWPAARCGAVGYLGSGARWLLFASGHLFVSSDTVSSDNTGRSPATFACALGSDSSSMDVDVGGVEEDCWRDGKRGRDIRVGSLLCRSLYCVSLAWWASDADGRCSLQASGMELLLQIKYPRLHGILWRKENENKIRLTPSVASEISDIQDTQRVRWWYQHKARRGGC
jgi:hypothetical protein